jgi:topoisomerase-4 subunit A
MVIKDNHPWETDVHEILTYNANSLVEFLRRELQIEKERLLEKIFSRTLERIFIEDRIYKKIETIKTLEAIHSTLATAFKPYIKKLLREPTQEDREKLLQIPIRRISQFDIDKNSQEIILLQEMLAGVERDLKNVKKYTINYLKKLIEKFGKLYPRKTKIKAIEEIDRRAIETKKIKVGYDPETGFLGTKVSGSVQLECTNFDKLLVFYKNGTYTVINIPDKQYLENVTWVGVADKKTIHNVLYKNTATKQTWVKRFVVDKFILDKIYNFLDTDAELQYFSVEKESTLELQFYAKPRQKVKSLILPLKNILIKGAQARGTRVAAHEVKKIGKPSKSYTTPDMFEG